MENSKPSENALTWKNLQSTTDHLEDNTMHETIVRMNQYIVLLSQVPSKTQNVIHVNIFDTEK